MVDRSVFGSSGNAPVEFCPAILDIGGQKQRQLIRQDTAARQRAKAVRRSHSAACRGMRRRTAVRIGCHAMQEFFCVYRLRSLKKPAEVYVGFTDDLKARLAKHNGGGCPHTAKYRPWRIETAVAFRDPAKARAFEAYLKSGSGREFARRHF